MARRGPSPRLQAPSASRVSLSPDGNLGEYLRSLEYPLGRDQDRRYLPGRGPVLCDPHPLVNSLIDQRRHRSQQILDLLSHQPATIAEMVPVLYATVAKQVWPAAAASLYAHVLHLEGPGLVESADLAPLRRVSRLRRVT